MDTELIKYFAFSRFSLEREWPFDSFFERFTDSAAELFIYLFVFMN